jgi:hypothetical protein
MTASGRCWWRDETQRRIGVELSFDEARACTVSEARANGNDSVILPGGTTIRIGCE